MEWFGNVKKLLRGSAGTWSAVVGLACALTCMGSMRLNTISGIYPVELSLIVRHALGAVACLLALAAHARLRKPHILSAGFRRVLAVALCAAAVLLLKYSEFLFIATSPAATMLGKLLEEFFCVLLILVWAERIVEWGFSTALACVSSSIALFAGIQVLLSFFQRTPCMLALVLMPVVSAFAFRSYLRSRPADAPEPAGATPQARPVPQARSPWPLDLTDRTTASLFFGILLCFVFVAGQILRTTLDYQQQGLSSQLAIALGNGIAGVVLLLLVDRFGATYHQPRLTLALVFLTIFALVTISFSLMAYTHAAAVAINLALVSICMQFIAAIIWAAAFSPAPTALTPCMVVALGYACNLTARTASSTVMWLPQAVPGFPEGIATGVALALAFVLCVALIARTPESKAATGEAPAAPGEAHPEPAALRTETPFKSAIAAVARDYGLTTQEGGVLALCAQGKSARVIAEEMGVSLNTTKSHMRTLYAKLGVHSQQDLIKLVDEVKRAGRET